jgi:hypothetical protein
MVIAAAFTLLKLLNSFFASEINLEYGRGLFTRTIRAIRDISVTNNDLPSRLAEVLAQLWRSGGAGQEKGWKWEVDGSLQLKVRCRMSMSLVYDSVWRWREEFQAKGRGNLECELALPMIKSTAHPVIYLTFQTQFATRLALPPSTPTLTWPSRAEESHQPGLQR